MVDKQKTDNTSDLPMVSVLALCYNHSDYLALTLDSIVKQTYTNIQLIIIDDCSQDNSVEVITRFIEDKEIECVFIKHTENKGICKSLNEAIDFIEGKYYHLIACDDILMHNTIERHVSLLENSESNVAVVYSDAILINEKGEFYDNRFIAYHKSYLNAPSGFIFEELINGNFIPAMTVTYKSSALREIGFWDETLVYEDYDMWLRLSRKYKFLFDN
ncbi:MAG: glycosyltransferase, partial [Bacteroidales bacterium]